MHAYNFLYEDEFQSINATVQFGIITQTPMSLTGYLARCEVIDLVEKTSTVHRLSESNLQTVLEKIFNMIHSDCPEGKKMQIWQLPREEIN